MPSPGGMLTKAIILLKWYLLNSQESERVDLLDRLYKTTGVIMLQKNFSVKRTSSDLNTFI